MICVGTDYISRVIFFKQKPFLKRQRVVTIAPSTNKTTDFCEEKILCIQLNKYTS